MDKKCCHCEFYKDFMKSYGNCHLNPPGIDGRGMSIWPKVHEADWCGHFSQRADSECEEVFVDEPHVSYSGEYSAMFRKTFGIDPLEVDFRIMEKPDKYVVLAMHKPSQIIVKSEDADKNIAKTRALEKLIQRLKMAKAVN